MSKTLSTSYSGYAVLLLLLANIANYGQRMLLAILLPNIKADVGLTDAQLGILMGGAFAVCYAIAGVPLARFAERHGRVRWLAIAVAFWSGAADLSVSNSLGVLGPAGYSTHERSCQNDQMSRPAACIPVGAAEAIAPAIN